MSERKISLQTIIDEAADWAVRLDAAQLSSVERDDLLAWLRTSPRHVEEFLKVSSMFEDMSFLDGLEDLDGPEAGVTPIPARRVALWRPMLVGALAACVAIAVAIGVFLSGVAGPDSNTERLVAQTEIGGSQILSLPDGTQVTMNTATAAEFLLTDSMRAARLDKGEAFFEVAHDTNRPFYILAGDAMIEVVGTSFSTRLTPEGTQLQVAEGKVDFGRISEPVSDLEELSENPRALSMTVRVVAGESAYWPAGAVAPEVSEIDPDTVALWRGGRVVFRQTRLRDVVDEFNRYNTELISIEGEALAEELLSAEFDPRDLEGFLRFIEITRPNIEIIRTDHSIILSNGD